MPSAEELETGDVANRAQVGVDEQKLNGIDVSGYDKPGDPNQLGVALNDRTVPEISPGDVASVNTSVTGYSHRQQVKDNTRGRLQFENRSINKTGTAMALTPTRMMSDSKQEKEKPEEYFEEKGAFAASVAEGQNLPSQPQDGRVTEGFQDAASTAFNGSQHQQQGAHHQQGLQPRRAGAGALSHEDPNAEELDSARELFTAELVDENALRQEAIEDWEREVMNRTVTAKDVVIVDESKRRRRVMLMVFVATIIVAAILVGTLVPLFSRDSTQIVRIDTNNDSNNTIPPASIPPATLAPDAFAITNNTKCVDALPISTRQGPVTYRSNLQNTSMSMEFHSYSCAADNITERMHNFTGRWYNFNSSGYTNSTIYAQFCVTEGSSVELKIYTGDCDHLVCLAGEGGAYQYSLEDSHFNSSTMYCTRILFHATEGVDYKLFVTGSKEEEPYSITTSDANDLCVNAYPLGDLDTQMHGLTLGASPDTNVAICDNNIYSHNDTRKTPGVWYHVLGLGTGVSIDTCGSSFPARISIFVSEFGPYCKELHCYKTVISNNDVCDGQSEVSWFAENARRYYVLFHGDETNAARNSSLEDFSGKFSYYVRNFDAPLVCDGAIPILIDNLFVAHHATVHGKHPGPNATAWSETMASRLFCNNSGDPVSVETSGTWYRFKGFDGTIAFSTCSNETNYDTKISVYQGSNCSHLVCVAANDDVTAPECQNSLGGSYVQFSAESGRNYFVFIHGSKTAANQSNYTLDFKVQSCSDIQGPFVADGSRLQSTTIGAVPRNLSACNGPERAPSAVFLFYGTGATMTASTCHETTDFETRLSIMTRTCIDSLWTCLASDVNSTSSCGDGQSTVSWVSDPGGLYYVVVYGNALDNSVSATGNFGLSVTSGTGDSCSNAVGPSGYPFSLYASAAGSMIDISIPDGNVSNCGIWSPERQGVWYTLDGVSEKLSLQVCPLQESGNISATVYSGDCNLLECVTSSWTDICGPENALVLPGNENLTHHVFIQGPSLYSDNSFEFTAIPLSGGSTCETAQSIPESYFSEGRLFMGSTLDASWTFPNGTVLGCGTMNISWPGTWFKVEGLSGALNLDTCWKPNSEKYNWNMSLDTQLAVFAGTCDQLVCVIDNDDSWCDGVSSYQSNVTFVSDLSTVYYIFVSGYEGAMGDFVLNTRFRPGLYNANGNWCDSPIEVSTTTLALGTTIQGRISGNNAISASNSCVNDMCHLGLWYRIKGIDGTIKATTLNSSKTLAIPVNNGIFVLTGTCRNQTCINSSHGQPSDGLSHGGVISFNATASESYYIVVCSNPHQGSYYGDFVLTLKLI